MKFKSFWIVSAIAAGLFFVAFLNFNRTYRAETDTLILAKSLPAAENSEQIIENIQTATRLLLPSGLNIERLRKSGILKITAQSKSQSEAEILNNLAVSTLISASSQYYNIKTDIDIRIIKKATIRYAGVKSVSISILESLVAGLVLAFLSFYLSFGLFSKKTEGQIFFTSPKKRETKKQVAVKKTWFSQEKPYAAFSKKAEAPQNLPIAKEASLFEGEKKFSKKDEVKKEKPIIREATPEEVKERLNKLLSGNF